MSLAVGCVQLRLVVPHIAAGFNGHGRERGKSLLMRKQVEIHENKTNRVKDSKRKKNVFV